MKKSFLAALALAGASVLPASAITLTVLPTDPTWVNPPSENGDGTGSAVITDAAPHDGTGSLELHGDRTRFFGLGNPYDSVSNLGLLKDLTGFTFDWMVALDSAGLGPGAAESYSPALRLHIWDGTQRIELIWENAYNGGQAAEKGTWYTTESDDIFWEKKAGFDATEDYTKTIANWSDIYGDDAYIAGVSIGVGSTSGSGYHAFADNVTLTFGDSSTTYNFETPAASVPDGGATLMLLGGAFTGLAALRRKFNIL